MRTHLVPTPEAFAAWVRRTYGPDSRLDPANRLTACGRRMGELNATTDPARVTCKACGRSAS